MVNGVNVALKIFESAALRLTVTDSFLHAAVQSTQAASILPTEVYCIRIRSCDFAFWLIVKALRHEMASGLNPVN